MFSCCHKYGNIEPCKNDVNLSRKYQVQLDKFTLEPVSSENSDILHKLSKYSTKQKVQCYFPSHLNTDRPQYTERKPFTKLLQKRNTYVCEKQITSPKLNDTFRKRIGSITNELTQVRKTQRSPNSFCMFTPSSNSQFKFSPTYFRPRMNSTQSTHITSDSINSGRPLLI
jgi:hypothetical protein